MWLKRVLERISSSARAARKSSTYSYQKRRAKRLLKRPAHGRSQVAKWCKLPRYIRQFFRRLCGIASPPCDCVQCLH
eukprot:5973112-Pleurochrysis_carterae.AAC.1